MRHYLPFHGTFRLIILFFFFLCRNVKRTLVFHQQVVHIQLPETFFGRNGIIEVILWHFHLLYLRTQLEDLRRLVLNSVLQPGKGRP